MAAKAIALNIILAALSLAPSGRQAVADDPIRCTILMDVDSGATRLREGTCDRPVYPMSTFKLPLAVMGYDAGILVDAKTPLWSYQASFDRPKRERKATDPTIWERDSIVWYSQEVTRRLGKAAFENYVRRLDYGNRDVSSGPGKLDGLTGAWLMASLKISPDQQVDFVRRLLKGELPVSAEAVENTRAIMPVFKAGNGWEIHGKTGSGWLRNTAGKIDRARPLGWFVGWAQKDGQEIAFARLFIDTVPHADPISLTTRDSLIADFAGLMP
ncbi:class D beta-lactamase [Agrobacterium sp. ES01]|uniref:class D beta-lactamase n=1 Tax=Agrobacterium sp. ES01 TaxID=3420714 RepID=UPI003D0D4F7D